MNPPKSGIVFVNNDLTENTQQVLARQLFIDEVITGIEFDARVVADPNYATVVHLNNLRIMVVRSFYEATNRELADVVIFVKAGLASVESNKFGPPGLNLSIDRLYWNQILAGTTPNVTTVSRNPNLQDNILHPLKSTSNIVLGPFGSDD